MRPLVWLPFDPAELGDPPSSFAYEVVDPTDSVPDSVGQVEIYVPPYAVGPAVADVIGQMTSLRYVQALTAGVDNLRSAIPPGVTLCSGRGIHDTSTAELVLTLVLASLRGVPSFVRAQDRHEWTPGWHPALADRTVLLVGYGAIGAAIEARLVPFECTVVRVARSARDGVHPISELPSLLPENYLIAATGMWPFCGAIALARAEGKPLYFLPFFLTAPRATRFCNFS